MLPMETMVKQWEDAYEVAPLLSEFFSSEDGKSLIKVFLTEADRGESKPDPEILPFIFLCYVLPEPYWEKLPTLAERKRIARLLNQAAREIRNLSTSNFLGPSESTGGVVDQLKGWGNQLLHPKLMISWKFHIIDERPSLRRHRAKRRVVFFLDGYFRAIGRISPPWKLITKVLKATKLVKSNAREKDIGTWWGDVKKRDRRLGKPLEPAQDKHVQKFYELKKKAAEGFEGTMVLKWEADM